MLFPHHNHCFPLPAPLYLAFTGQAGILSEDKEEEKVGVVEAVGGEEGLGASILFPNALQ